MKEEGKNGVKDVIIGNQVIGQGAYAMVKVGFHVPSQLEVAIKIYDKAKMQDSIKKNTVKSEISILSSLDHPGIIKLYQHFEDFNKIYLVMEYGGSCNLKDFVVKQKGKFSLLEARIVFCKILEAVSYMHERNVVHRDLKLHNIVLNSIFCPKIVDFGFARQASSIQSNEQCGTPNYMSPEMIMKSKKCEPKQVDMWALGIILFHLAVGQNPFKCKLA